MTLPALPKMREFGNPDANLMQCRHCEAVMGRTLLMQVAHHHQCDGGDPVIVGAP